MGYRWAPEGPQVPRSEAAALHVLVGGLLHCPVPLAFLVWPVTLVRGPQVASAAEHMAEERNWIRVPFIVGRWPV